MPGSILCSNFKKHPSSYFSLKFWDFNPSEMVYSVLLFAFRKPGTSPAEFKAHYEGTHIPLLKSIAGPLFPISHTRRYIHRSEVSEPTGNEKNAKYPASLLAGEQADFGYDAFAELTFKDEAAFGAFFGHMNSAENAEKIAADEDKFLDRARMTAVVVGDCVVTTEEKHDRGKAPLDRLLSGSFSRDFLRNQDFSW